MLKNWRFFPALSAFLLAEPSLALVLKATPVLLLNAAAPTQTQSGISFGWTGTVATGFGLLGSVQLGNSPFDLEWGLIQLNEASSRESSGQTLSRSTRSLHYPLLLHFHFDSRVGLGIGGYASVATGSLPTGTHDHDFGLLLSVRSSLNVVSTLDFIIEGRYQHGLTNLATIPPGTAGDLINTRSMQAYLGLCYTFSLFDPSTQSSDLSSPGW